jgi:hypothetical protein
MKTKILFSITFLFSALFFFNCSNDADLSEKEHKDNVAQESEQEAISTHTQGDEYVDGYIVGYETCGLEIGDGKGIAKAYMVITEDLKDTLAVYNLPQDIYVFPENLFSDAKSKGLINASFRTNNNDAKQYRYAFKIRFDYTSVSEETLQEHGLKEDCVIPAIYLVRHTYENCVPVVINSAIKIQ